MVKLIASDTGGNTSPMQNLVKCCEIAAPEGLRNVRSFRALVRRSYWTFAVRAERRWKLARSSVAGLS